MTPLTLTNDNLISSISDIKLRSLIIRHNTTLFKMNNSFNDENSHAFEINNNVDLVHDLVKYGFKDLLSKSTTTHSHILEKDNILFYVRSHIEAHHYFD